jgi:PAS domain S-box-containing protein
MGPVSEAPDRRFQQRRTRWGRRSADSRPIFKARVLVIEPHDDTRMLYAMMLEEAGYAVYAVANGVDALSLAQQRLPDLVVLEIAVPRVDGFGILQSIRQNAATADIPAVVVTAALRYDMPARARETGATVVLTKPTPVDILLRLADELIETTPPARLMRRQLRRTLATIAKVAAQVTLDEAARSRVRSLIDRLQIAVLAMDQDGRHVAASAGAESLTGYTRAELLTMSIQDVLFGGEIPAIDPPNPGDAVHSVLPDASIQHSDGRLVPVEALIATVLPGLHAAAFAAAPATAAPERRGGGRERGQDRRPG